MSFQFESAQLKLVCYYRINGDFASSSRRHPTNAFNHLPILNINGSICTHLIVGFASISNGTVSVPDDKELVNVRLLKDKFPHLKVLMSLGGGGNTASFHSAFFNHSSRQVFIDSTVQFLSKYSLDGLDVDWEFPGWSKYESDVTAFPLLLSQMRKTFDTIERKLLLTVAVSASYTVIKVSYQHIKLIHTSVDWINLMSYDFHDFSLLFPFVEHNAPLLPRADDQGFLATLNTKWAAWYWTDYLGVPKDKLVIGIPFYTHNYILSNRNLTKPGSPAVAEAPEMSYSQVCNVLKNCSNCQFFDDEAKVPYAVVGSLWISYENTQSICLKAKWARANGFAGCMTFDLNTDDFIHACSNDQSFVLQQTLFNCLH